MTVKMEKKLEYLKRKFGGLKTVNIIATAKKKRKRSRINTILKAKYKMIQTFQKMMESPLKISCGWSNRESQCLVRCSKMLLLQENLKYWLKVRTRQQNLAAVMTKKMTALTLWWSTCQRSSRSTQVKRIETLWWRCLMRMLMVLVVLQLWLMVKFMELVQSLSRRLSFLMNKYLKSGMLILLVSKSSILKKNISFQNGGNT